MSEVATFSFVVRDIASHAVVEEGSASWVDLHSKFPGLMHCLPTAPMSLVRRRPPEEHVPWAFELHDHGNSGELLCKRSMNSGQPLGTAEAVTEVVIVVPVTMLQE